MSPLGWLAIAVASPEWPEKLAVSCPSSNILTLPVEVEAKALVPIHRVAVTWAGPAFSSSVMASSWIE